MLTGPLKTIEQAIMQGFMSNKEEGRQKSGSNRNMLHRKIKKQSSTKKWKRIDTPFMLVLTICIALLPFITNASTLEIINDDTAKVEIFIEAGDGKIISDAKPMKYKLAPKTQMNIEVSNELIEGNTVFSIIGKVKMPSLYNRCKGLFTDRDYKIVFVSSKAGGVVCYAEELGLFD